MDRMHPLRRAPGHRRRPTGRLPPPQIAVTPFCSGCSVTCGHSGEIQDQNCRTERQLGVARRLQLCQRARVHLAAQAHPEYLGAAVRCGHVGSRIRLAARNVGSESPPVGSDVPARRGPTGQASRSSRARISTRMLGGSAEPAGENCGRPIPARDCSKPVYASVMPLLPAGYASTASVDDWPQGSGANLNSIDVGVAPTTARQRCPPSSQRSARRCAHRRQFGYCHTNEGACREAATTAGRFWWRTSRKA
jgi:hypothetical protein